VLRVVDVLSGDRGDGVPKGDVEKLGFFRTHKPSPTPPLDHRDGAASPISAGSPSIFSA
jgi:hypothetical protein